MNSTDIYQDGTIKFCLLQQAITQRVYFTLGAEKRHSLEPTFREGVRRPRATDERCRPLPGRLDAPNLKYALTQTSLPSKSKRPPQQRLKQMFRLAQGFALLTAQTPVSAGYRRKLFLEVHWWAGH